MKLQASACNFMKREILAQVFSCECCKISKKNFSCRTPPVAASLNPVICETNETINLSLSAIDTSFVNERNESHDKKERSPYCEKENPAEYSENQTQIRQFLFKIIIKPVVINSPPAQLSNCSVSFSDRSFLGVLLLIIAVAVTEQLLTKSFSIVSSPYFLL